MKLKKMISAGLLVMVTVTSVSVIASGHMGNQNGSDGIKVNDSYVRMVPPGQKNTGVFMTINNHGDKLRTIISAESPAAKVVELHTHIKEDGMMKMRQIPKIDVPAKGKVTLKPGGLHVMLIGLNHAIEAGKPVDVTLVFKNGERLGLKAPGRKLKMKMMHHEMKHDMKADMNKMHHNMKH